MAPADGPPAGSAIVVADLVKRFDSVTAVDGIDFTVQAGSTTALLGGNGAGKTTTISILLGLLMPTSGTVEVMGVDMLRDRYRALGRMNFSSPYVDLPRRLTVAENLRVYGRLYGVRSLKQRIAELARDLDLDEFLDRRTGNLSAGQRTRVTLAKALLNRPQLLLLDEPTASLDPDTGDTMRSYLEALSGCDRRDDHARLAQHGRSRASVRPGADDAAGRIVDRGSPGDLIARYGRRTMEEVFLDIARHRVTDTDWAAQLQRMRPESERPLDVDLFFSWRRIVGDAAAPPLRAAPLLAAHPGARLLADGADGAVGFRDAASSSSTAPGWHRPAGVSDQRRPALGRLLPRQPRRLARLHGGDVGAQPGPAVRQPAAADELIAALAMMSMMRTRDRRPAGGAAVAAAVRRDRVRAGAAARRVLRQSAGLRLGGRPGRLGARPAARPGAESLAWVAVFAFAPLSGVYYPIDVLPSWLQPAGLVAAVGLRLRRDARRPVRGPVPHRSAGRGRLAQPRLPGAGGGFFLRVCQIARERGLLVQQGE